MILFTLAACGVFIWWPAFYAWSSNKKENAQPKPLSEIEMRVLLTIDSLESEGHLFVNREDVAKVLNTGPFQTFNIMDRLAKAKYLIRTGWDFTLSAEGKHFIRHV